MQTNISSEPIDPRKLMHELQKIVNDNTIVTTGVGEHQMDVAHFIKFSRPRQFITSGGLGTMGFGFPAAIGAKVGKPDKEVISKLKALTKDIDILIVLGTWCGDSQEQVPQFLKVIDKMKFPEERLVIVGVDREKESEDMEMSNYDIVLVPTMIVFKGREEIGRITETPETTLEQDLLSILE